MALDLFAGIPVSDYQAARASYERLFGAEPSFVAHETSRASSTRSLRRSPRGDRA